VGRQNGAGGHQIDDRRPQTALGQRQAERQPDHSAARNHHIRLLQGPAPITPTTSRPQYRQNHYLAHFTGKNPVPVIRASSIMQFSTKIVLYQILTRHPGNWPAS
jgi:hypothetical protein